jgi:phage-related protein
MAEGAKKLPAAFYRTSRGGEPVRDLLRTLSDADRRILGFDIGLVEFGWPVGMPLSRSLGGGLWEIRSSLTDGRIARVMFCIADGRLILLHAFIKKTQRTPQGELDLARKRQREFAK